MGGPSCSALSGCASAVPPFRVIEALPVRPPYPKPDMRVGTDRRLPCDRDDCEHVRRSLRIKPKVGDLADAHTVEQHIRTKQQAGDGRGKAHAIGCPFAETA